MKIRKIFQTAAFSLTAILVAFFVGTISVQADQETCPDGGDWTKIDSSDLSQYPVDGAVEYCFKAGSDQSNGCEGGIFSSWPQPEGTCGLSHWSYKLGDPPCDDCECDDSCACEETVTCPSECGYQGGEIEGKCGTIKCDATPSCENPYWGIFVECVQNYDEGYMARFGYKWDGSQLLNLDRSDLTPGNVTGSVPASFNPGRHTFDVTVNHLGNEVWTVKALDKQKTSTASPNYEKKCEAECEETVSCPTECGYQGGNVQGECGVLKCPATNACPTQPPTPYCDDTDATNYGKEESCDYPTDGKHSSMGKNGPSCDRNDIEVTYDARENGDGRENVEVTFNYGGEEKKVKTNSDGRARVNYGYKGEGSITAKATDGYPDQAVHIESFDYGTCQEEPARGGAVLGTSTVAPPDNGQVLGTTSVMAATGTVQETVNLYIRMILGFVTGVAVIQLSRKAEVTA